MRNELAVILIGFLLIACGTLFLNDQNIGANLALVGGA